MTQLKEKTLLITGGTGSFGNAVLDRFLTTDIGEIRIFSRDEKKQDDMRHAYQLQYPEYADKLRFYIGDVREPASIRDAMHDVDYVFHAAALKQVTSCGIQMRWMPRFIMSLEEAVDLVLFAFVHGTNGDILVQKAPACTIGDQARALLELFHADNEVKIIGIRHGEKLYETLLTNEECAHAEDLGNFYRVPCDKRGLNYDQYFTAGDTQRNPFTEFNSSNTRQLMIPEIQEKLLSLAYIRKELEAWEQRT